METSQNSISESTEKKQNILLSWKDLFQSILNYKRELTSAHLIAFLSVTASVPIPLMIPLLVDEVLLEKPGIALAWMNTYLPNEYQKPFAYIVVIFVLVIIMRLLALFLSVWQERQFTIIAKNISFKIRSRVIHHLEKVHLKTYETEGTGGLSARCLNDVATLEDFISGTLAKLLISSLSLAGTAIVLLWIDSLLGAIILLLNPAVIVFSRSFAAKVKHLKNNENASFEDFQQALIESLDAIGQLRVLNWHSHYFQEVISYAKDFKEKSIQSKWRTQAMSRLSFTTFLLGYEFFRSIALLMVVYSNLSIGQIFAVFGYLWYMMGPIQEILAIQYSYYASMAAIRRINQIFSMPSEKNQCGDIDPFSSSNTTKIELKDVYFSYQKDTPILKNIQMSLQPKQTTALVSVSGGGKSTLVRLLLGLYEKDSGQIYFNNVTIEKVIPNALRNHISVVLQDPKFFNASLYENFCIGGEVDKDRIWKTLELTKLKETVQAWPDKLNTKIGRNGIRLSGGQRQRLALSRALLSNSQVLILDEATSALDAETERKVFSNIAPILKNKTVLIIGHRLNTIKFADKIYVLDDGQITQSGQHNALIQEKGLYQTLYSHQ